jgi:Zn-dependent protease with chaperone function
LWAQYQDVLATLDWKDLPELYVSQTPLVNAAAVGFDRPFIVLNSGTIALLDEGERRDILGHELGHIMSGHTTYTTIAIIILTVGIQNLPFLAGMALLPFQLALMEWYRKAELSADRAGLLVTQDPKVSMSTFLKMAGGAAGDDDISVEPFMEQAEAYETGGDFADKVWQVINTAFRTHPFGTVRAAELQRWVKSGEYDRILAGEYRRRSDASTPPLSDDYVDAAGYYGQQARGAIDSLSEVFDRARDAFNSAFKGPSGT